MTKPIPPNIKETKTITKSYKKVLEELINIGVPLDIKRIIKVGQINTNKKSQLGVTYLIGEKIYIGIEKRVTRKHYRIIAHELVHTLPMCMNHGRNFKYWANYINNKIPDYMISTHIDCNNHILDKNIGFKYMCTCTACGNVDGYFRKTPAVENPLDFICGVCKAEDSLVITKCE